MTSIPVRSSSWGTWRAPDAGALMDHHAAMGDYEAAVTVTHSGTAPESGPLRVAFRNSRTGQPQEFSIDEFTGGHLLHLAVAACVLNDMHREAQSRGVPIDGVLVEECDTKKLKSVRRVLS